MSMMMYMYMYDQSHMYMYDQSHMYMHMYTMGGTAYISYLLFSSNFISGRTSTAMSRLHNVLMCHVRIYKYKYVYIYMYTYEDVPCTCMYMYAVHVCYNYAALLS